MRAVFTQSIVRYPNLLPASPSILKIEPFRYWKYVIVGFNVASLHYGFVQSVTSAVRMKINTRNSAYIQRKLYCEHHVRRLAAIRFVWWRDYRTSHTYAALDCNIISHSNLLSVNRTLSHTSTPCPNTNVAHSIYRFPLLYIS